MFRKDGEIMSKNEIMKNDDNNVVIPYLKTDADGEISYPTCKLCNTEFRKEIENYYDHHPNYRGLVRWIKNTYDISVSYPAVRNHIINHYKASQKYQFMEGYADDIKRWLQIPNARIPALKRRRAMLEREMVGLGAETDDLTGDDKRKNIELMRKVADTLLVYDAKIDEHYQKVEPVTMILSQLNIIMKEVMNKPHVDETKEAFDEVLARLENAIGDIINEEK